VSFGAKFNGHNSRASKLLQKIGKYFSEQHRTASEILDGSLLVVDSHENISDLEIGNTTIKTRSFQLRGKMPSKICLSYLAKIYVTR